MKMVYILFVFLLISSKADTQVWVDQGATWHYDYEIWLLIGFIKYEYTSDTLIDNIQCQKIESNTHDFSEGQSSIIPRPTNYTYVSGDTVFYRKNGQFFALFDFGAQIGDSWAIGITSDSSNNCNNDTSKVIVTNTGTITLNNINYRYIQLDTFQTPELSLRGVFVERFGLIGNGYHHDLFPVMEECPGTIAEWINKEFKCFQDDSFLLYNPSNEDCEYLNIEKEIQNTISIYPNPISNKLTISYNSKDKLNIEIIDISGRKIIEQNGIYANESIDISDLNKGIYILSVLENGKLIYNKKIIKN